MLVERSVLEALVPVVIPGSHSGDHREIGESSLPSEHRSPFDEPASQTPVLRPRVGFGAELQRRSIDVNFPKQRTPRELIEQARFPGQTEAQEADDAFFGRNELEKAVVSRRRLVAMHSGL